MLDLFLFAALPYVAVVLFVGVSVQRYRHNPYSFSSLSSQFLESKRLFWGSVPFHIGVIVLFFRAPGRLLFPRQVVIWNSVPARLFILETTAMIAALLCLVGIVGLMYRRATSSRLRATTSTADLVVYALLLFQIGTGLWSP